MGIEWAPEGRCRIEGTPTSFFYPDLGDSCDDQIAFCDQCTVRLDCLEHALSVNEKDGVWGGTTAPARRKILRRRRLANNPAIAREATTETFTWGEDGQGTFLDD